MEADMTTTAERKTRCVQQQVAGHPAVDGAGVHLVRVLGA